MQAPKPLLFMQVVLMERMAIPLIGRRRATWLEKMWLRKQMMALVAMAPGMRGPYAFSGLGKYTAIMRKH